MIISRYLTTKPKLSAGIELREITLNLGNTNEDALFEALNEWYDKWKEFLKERTTNVVTGKWHYTHKKLRSAYRSLKTNLPYLFTYQKYPELNIPNTTNSIDGTFSKLKALLNVHRGLVKDRKLKIIDAILSK